MLDIEEFFEENQSGVEQSASKFQTLVSSLAFDLNCVSNAQDELDRMDYPAVAIFFQLPYCLNLEDDWFTIDTTRSGVEAKVKLSSRSLLIDHLGHASVSEIGTVDASIESAFTQVTAIIPLWGGRESFYQTYLGEDESSSRIIVPAAESWDSKHLPMTAADYEYNLSRRYFLEAKNIQKKVIPTYRLLSMHDVTMSDRIYGYCVLTQPYRITSHHIPDPIVRGMIEKRRTKPHRHVSIQDFAKFYKPRSTFSPSFETQLFKSQRLIADEEFDLAVISLHTAIEGFLKAKLPNRIPKIKMQGLLNHTSYKFLPVPLVDNMHSMRELRNSIIHADDAGQSQTYHKDNKQMAAKSDVEAFLNNAFTLYREVNMHTT